MPIFNPVICSVDATETRRYAGLRKAVDFGEENIFDACREALLLIDVRGVRQLYNYANQTVASDPPFRIAKNLNAENFILAEEESLCQFLIP